MSAADRIVRPRLTGRVSAALKTGSVLLTAGGGFGKTTLLEQALAESAAPVAWVSCAAAERSAGVLLKRIVDAIAVAAPGASAALAERLAAAAEHVDPVAAVRELLVELSALLLEPLVLVIDNAEQLEENAEESLRLVDELLRAENTQLRVAVAARREPGLRTGKARAAGRLDELTAADLAFSTEDCAALVRAHTGADPPADHVTAILRATGGWPFGTALAVGLLEGTPGGDGRLSELPALPDLTAYFTEEMLDSMKPALREALLASSIPRIVTPAAAAALALPAEFSPWIQHSGIPTRDRGDGAFSYHPLMRDFLRVRLREERTSEAVRNLHAAVAPAVAEAGDGIGSVEHWLAAERWDDAVTVIEREGPPLLTTSPETIAQWLAALPDSSRRLPTCLMLSGQLEWVAGRHTEAAEPLREAVAGYGATRDEEEEWQARLVLADALLSIGAFAELFELSEGWDGARTDAARTSSHGVGWYRVLALAGLGRIDEAELLVETLRADELRAPRFRYLDDVAQVAIGTPAGRGREIAAHFHETIRSLELDDPDGRLPIPLAVAALVHLDLGERVEALDCLERCERESDRLGLGFVSRETHLRRASMLAERGKLAEAQVALARAGELRGTGWRGVSRHRAEAVVASLRGDREEALAAAERAIARVAPGIILFRVWTALELAPVLAENGVARRAHEIVAGALTDLDEHFPGPRGHYHRARLLAVAAWLGHIAGDRDAASSTLLVAWAEAGDCAADLLRAQWPAIQPVVWAALSDGVLPVESVVAALDGAAPNGEALLPFAEHPEPEVRGATLRRALESNHPAALARLADLSEDDDERVAAAASATQVRLRDVPVPLHYRLLGPFGISRSGWDIPESTWARPMDPRLVRLLLVSGGDPVVEDVIFEALWPESAPDSARRSLQVVVSRARRVLDLPGAQRSAIENLDGAYRLALSDRDRIDAEEFAVAAEAAVAAAGDERRSLLERARALWTGEPLPEERYADWATAYRERLLDRYVAVLTAIVEDDLTAGDHSHATEAARELVDLDPLNEGAHRALMTAYARAGRTGHALRQFLECRRALIDQLGVEPAQRTSRLQARILAGEVV
jgi:ATP/maltotriose-dependent transcriptional regulator MalT/DNA-binding SARP family transcriptional activator